MFRKAMIATTIGFGLAAWAAPADAAISVLGGGLASSCYQAAEFGTDTQEGIKTCTNALNETAMNTRDRAASLINRGILRANAGDFDSAMEDYNHGLMLDATLGEGYVDRGATEIVLKNYQDAVNDITKGISLNSNKIEIAYYDRAIANEALGNIRDAYTDYKKAVELRPDFALATQQLTRFKVVRKHTDGA